MQLCHPSEYNMYNDRPIFNISCYAVTQSIEKYPYLAGFHMINSDQTKSSYGAPIEK